MAAGQLNTALRYLRKVATLRRAREWSDGALLERFAGRGEEAAFEALLGRHGPMVLGVCRRVLGDAHAAEDAFQATFLVLVRHAGAISKGGSVGSWLHGVAYRTALKARAALAARRRHERQVATMPNSEPSAAAAWDDLRQVLDEEVGRLPEACRGPFVLCYLEGKTYDEAARQLGCPKGTVSTRLTRAREILRARLTRRGLALSAGLLSAALAQNAAPAVPPALSAATAHAAAGAAAPHVMALAEGVVKAMLVSKYKFASAVLLALGLVVGGSGGLAYRTRAAEQPAAGQAPAAAQPQKKEGAPPPGNPDLGFYPPAAALVQKTGDAEARQRQEIVERIRRLIAMEEARTVFAAGLNALGRAEDDRAAEKALDDLEKAVQQLRRHFRRRPPPPPLADNTVWTLDFHCKDLRFALHAGYMAQSVCYLRYEVSNPTAQAHRFIPDFELEVPGTRSPYHDIVSPFWQKEVEAMEGVKGGHFANSITIAKPLLPAKSGGKPVTGVAIWDGLVTGDRCVVYVHGLTNAWKVGEDKTVRRKALKLEFQRVGKEMRQVGSPVWVYRPAPPPRKDSEDAIGQAQRKVEELQRKAEVARLEALTAKAQLDDLRRRRQEQQAPPVVKPGSALQVRLTGPAMMRVSLFPAAGEAKSAPCRFNLPLGSKVRLKLSNIPDRPGLVLYPTVEVMPANAKTLAFIANSDVPLTFTAEDFEKVTAGRLVTKVIYLNGQDGDGADEVASSKLEPGVDPVAEATRRGPLLLVVRLGGIDLEAPARRGPP